jgi:hypothetical protein
VTGKPKNEFVMSTPKVVLQPGSSRLHLYPHCLEMTQHALGLDHHLVLYTEQVHADPDLASWLQAWKDILQKMTVGQGVWRASFDKSFVFPSLDHTMNFNSL